jgi:hypothetical protein
MWSYVARVLSWSAAGSVSGMSGRCEDLRLPPSYEAVTALERQEHLRSRLKFVASLAKCLLGSRVLEFFRFHSARDVEIWERRVFMPSPSFLESCRRSRKAICSELAGAAVVSDANVGLRTCRVAPLSFPAPIFIERAGPSTRKKFFEFFTVPIRNGHAGCLLKGDSAVPGLVGAGRLPAPRRN